MPERWQHELGKLTTLEPPAGLWDRALRGPRREPPRSHRAWQVIAPVAAALAVAAVVAGTFALVRAFGPAARRQTSVVNYRPGRFADPVFGWSIRVPAGLRVRHFQVPCLHSPIAGVRVTSFAPDLRAPGPGILPLGWLRTFPADGVAVQIWYGCSLPFPGPLRDTAFPLSPSSFHRIRPYFGDAEPHPWYCDCYGDGISFSAAVWLGPQASRTEQQAAWAVVRSLRFPALREGTIYPSPRARSIYEDTYYVLGQASRYPVGSVTTFPAASLPGSRAIAAHVAGGFFLIHAPRAFYVIHRLFQEPTKPYTTCTLAFDARAFQFFCPGTDLRWNRVGQPIGARARAGQDLHLPLAPATVAQDGHVLFSPFWGDVLGVVLKGSPWG
jgi:hypothetical protein